MKSLKYDEVRVGRRYKATGPTFPYRVQIEAIGGSYDAENNCFWLDLTGLSESEYVKGRAKRTVFNLARAGVCFEVAS